MLGLLKRLKGERYVATKRALITGVTGQDGSYLAELLFDKASEYWHEALRLAPTNYLEAANWMSQRDTL